MKTAAAVLSALLLAQLCVATRDVRGDRRHRQHMRAEKQPVPPAGLTEAEQATPPPQMIAPSPSAGPSFSSSETKHAAVSDLELSFELANYNYHDLEKDVSDDASTKSDEDSDSFIQLIPESSETFGEMVASTVASVFEKIIRQGIASASSQAPVVGSSMPLIAPMAGSSMPHLPPMAGSSMPHLPPIAGSSMPHLPPIAGSSMPHLAPTAGSSMPLNALQQAPIAGSSMPEGLMPVVGGKAPIAGSSMPEGWTPGAGGKAPVAGSSMPEGWTPGAGGKAGAVTSGAPAPAKPAAAVVDYVTGQPVGTIDPTADQVNVFVTFRPGPRHQPVKDAFLQTGGLSARSTIVDVVITDKPLTGANLLPHVRTIIMQSQAEGLLMRRMKAALFQATGISPIVRGLSVPPAAAEVRQWDEDGCEKHMEKLVKRMEVAYTRRMVPQALYNECTNMIPSLSFSHDAVATQLDRKKCRIATIKFARRWNYGKASWNHGAGKDSHQPMDFSGYCRDVCETRFGEKAPQCQVDRQIQSGV